MLQVVGEPNPDGLPKIGRQIRQYIARCLVLQGRQRLDPSFRDELHIVIFFDADGAAFRQRKYLQKRKSPLIDIAQALFCSRERRA
jgi:hypothetical protein